MNAAIILARYCYAVKRTILARYFYAVEGAILARYCYAAKGAILARYCYVAAERADLEEQLRQRKRKVRS